jgi:hypothetical protein
LEFEFVELEGNEEVFLNEFGVQDPCLGFLSFGISIYEALPNDCYLKSHLIFEFQLLFSLLNFSKIKQDEEGQFGRVCFKPGLRRRLRVLRAP